MKAYHVFISAVIVFIAMVLLMLGWSLAGMLISAPSTLAVIAGLFLLLGTIMVVFIICKAAYCELIKGKQAVSTKCNCNCNSKDCK